jgi:hypothetical protein
MEIELTEESIESILTLIKADMTVESASFIDEVALETDMDVICLAIGRAMFNEKLTDAIKEVIKSLPKSSIS